MENKEKKFISAVVYVHNAQNRIGSFLRNLLQTLETQFEHSEIICVNDASDDDSLEEIRGIAGEKGDVCVSIVNLSYYHGMELAMNAGMDLSIGDYVYEFDCIDFADTADVIMQIYRKALEGYDIVSASPDCREKLTSRIFYGVFGRFSDLKYRITTESFRILSRRAINRVSSAKGTALYRKAVYANCGLKSTNIRFSAGRCKERGADPKDRIYKNGLAVDSLIVFTEVGYRFSMFMTILMMLIAVLGMVYTIAAYFTLHPVEGWTTTILFLSVCFIGLFGIQTIIIKYLQLIVDVAYKRRHYSFESVEKL